MNKIVLMNKIVVSVIAFFVLAALAMQVSASAKEDNLKLDEGSGSIAPGYGIVAYEISLTANPFMLPPDGKSTSTITAQLKDREGKNVKVKDITINFQTTQGTLSADSAVTDENGTATVELTSSNRIRVARLLAKSDSVLIPGHAWVIFW